MKNCEEKISPTMVVVTFLIILFNFNLCPASARAFTTKTGLEVDFYGETCPSAELIVRNAVADAVALKPGVAASLVRLPFHDCFVRGCDASVLLDPTPSNRTEKASPINVALRGFEVIDAAKSKLESSCPGIVSCADILQFAARDSALLAGGIEYQVPAGRRDGTTSSEEETFTNLPSPDSSATQLVQIFKLKGLSLDQMVTLSGAHSIGISSCAAFIHRIYNYSTTQNQDPSLSKPFAQKLRNSCPPTVLSSPINISVAVNLDTITPKILDNEYYVALEEKEGVLTSDQTLMSSVSTATLVRQYAKDRELWAVKFAEAMVSMASIDVLTGNQGEIRRNCRVVNPRK